MRTRPGLGHLVGSVRSGWINARRRPLRRADPCVWGPPNGTACGWCRVSASGERTPRRRSSIAAAESAGPPPTTMMDGSRRMTQLDFAISVYSCPRGGAKPRLVGVVCSTLHRPTQTPTDGMARARRSPRPRDATVAVPVESCRHNSRNDATSDLRHWQHRLSVRGSPVAAHASRRVLRKQRRGIRGDEPGAGAPWVSRRRCRHARRRSSLRDHLRSGAATTIGDVSGARSPRVVATETMLPTFLRRSSLLFPIIAGPGFSGLHRDRSCKSTGVL